jgi:hypothetical protein
MPRVAATPPEAGRILTRKNSFQGPSEDAGLSLHLDLRRLASKTIREQIFVILTPIPSLWKFVMAVTGINSSPNFV